MRQQVPGVLLPTVLPSNWLACPRPGLVNNLRASLPLLLRSACADLAHPCQTWRERLCADLRCSSAAAGPHQHVQQRRRGRGRQRRLGALGVNVHATRLARGSCSSRRRIDRVLAGLWYNSMIIDN